MGGRERVFGLVFVISVRGMVTETSPNCKGFGNQAVAA